MRFFILLVAIFLTHVLPGQNADPIRSSQFNLQTGEEYKSFNQSSVNAGFDFQKSISINYQKRKLNFFFVVKNILTELTKPDPAINKDGYHYKANPFFEIEETKGNTGFVKLGMTINLRFK